MWKANGRQKLIILENLKARILKWNYVKAKGEGSFKISAKRRVGKSLTEKLKSPPFSFRNFLNFSLDFDCDSSPHATAFASFFFFSISSIMGKPIPKAWRTPTKPPFQTFFNYPFFPFHLFFGPKCMFWRRKSPRGSPASSLIPLPPNHLNHRRPILILRFLFLSSVCSIVCVWCLWLKWFAGRICVLFRDCVIPHCAFLWVFGYGINDFI